MAGQSAETTADENGKWLVSIGPFEPGGPHTMSVRGSNEIVVNNVVVGEVWVTSGQSNMAWTVLGAANAQEEIASANYPLIRLFTVPRHPSLKPEEDVPGGRWVECSPQTVPGFSAVAYFFGRELHKRLGVPIGLIHSSWGGTAAEAWTSREGLESRPELKPLVDRLDQVLAKVPDARERFYEYFVEWEKKWRPYYNAMRQWQEAVEQAKKEGKEPPPKPEVEPPPPVGDNNTPTCLFYGMIHPLLNYSIRGAIWYQGESNAGRAYQYRVLFPALIQDWRRQWNLGDFPFYYVQLANFMAVQTEPAEASAWAELREAQTMALSLPNTGMAVIIDIGEANDIHPKNKQDVGKRLALWALAQTYGQQIVYSGPLYDRAEWIDPGHVRIHFKHTGSGLVANGDEL
ncbi:MAG: sialate O-acetylesterase, partial [Armatimonadetes bacterium]|nr:sialate O-acetylesterase [Armatimonadota bacterium]